MYSGRKSFSSENKSANINVAYSSKLPKRIINRASHSSLIRTETTATGNSFDAKTQVVDLRRRISSSSFSSRRSSASGILSASSSQTSVMRRPSHILSTNSDSTVVNYVANPIRRENYVDSNEKLHENDNSSTIANGSQLKLFVFTEPSVLNEQKRQLSETLFQFRPLTPKSASLVINPNSNQINSFTSSGNYGQMMSSNQWRSPANSRISPFPFNHSSFKNVNNELPIKSMSCSPTAPNQEQQQHLAFCANDGITQNAAQDTLKMLLMASNVRDDENNESEIEESEIENGLGMEEKNGWAHPHQGINLAEVFNISTDETKKISNDIIHHNNCRDTDEHSDHYENNKRLEDNYNSKIESSQSKDKLINITSNHDSVPQEYFDVKVSKKNVKKSLQNNETNDITNEKYLIRSDISNINNNIKNKKRTKSGLVLSTPLSNALSNPLSSSSSFSSQLDSNYKLNIPSKSQTAANYCHEPRNADATDLSHVDSHDFDEFSVDHTHGSAVVSPSTYGKAELKPFEDSFIQNAQLDDPANNEILKQIYPSSPPLTPDSSRVGNSSQALFNTHQNLITQLVQQNQFLSPHELAKLLRNLADSLTCPEPFSSSSAPLDKTTLRGLDNIEQEKTIWERIKKLSPDATPLRMTADNLSCEDSSVLSDDNLDQDHALEYFPVIDFASNYSVETIEAEFIDYKPSAAFNVLPLSPSKAPASSCQMVNCPFQPSEYLVKESLLCVKIPLHDSQQLSPCVAAWPSYNTIEASEDQCESPQFSHTVSHVPDGVIQDLKSIDEGSYLVKQNIVQNDICESLQKDEPMIENEPLLNDKRTHYKNPVSPNENNRFYKKANPSINIDVSNKITSSPIIPNRPKSPSKAPYLLLSQNVSNSPLSALPRRFLAKSPPESVVKMASKSKSPLYSSTTRNIKTSPNNYNSNKVLSTSQELRLAKPKVNPLKIKQLTPSAVRCSNNIKTQNQALLLDNSQVSAHIQTKCHTLDNQDKTDPVQCDVTELGSIEGVISKIIPPSTEDYTYSNPQSIASHVIVANTLIIPPIPPPLLPSPMQRDDHHFPILPTEESITTTSSFASNPTNSFFPPAVSCEPNAPTAPQRVISIPPLLLIPHNHLSSQNMIIPFSRCESDSDRIDELKEQSLNKEFNAEEREIQATPGSMHLLETPPLSSRMLSAAQSMLLTPLKNTIKRSLPPHVPYQSLPAVSRLPSLPSAPVHKTPCRPSTPLSYTAAVMNQKKKKELQIKSSTQKNNYNFPYTSVVSYKNQIANNMTSQRKTDLSSDTFFEPSEDALKEFASRASPIRLFTSARAPFNTETSPYLIGANSAQSDVICDVDESVSEDVHAWMDATLNRQYEGSNQSTSASCSNSTATCRPHSGRIMMDDERKTIVSSMIKKNNIDRDATMLLTRPGSGSVVKNIQPHTGRSQTVGKVIKLNSNK